jgi:hypothetical protein
MQSGAIKSSLKYLRTRESERHSLWGTSSAGKSSTQQPIIMEYYSTVVAASVDWCRSCPDSNLRYLSNQRVMSYCHILKLDLENDVRSILRMNTMSFRLVQTLSCSTSHMSSIVVLYCGKTVSCLL